MLNYIVENTENWKIWSSTVRIPIAGTAPTVLTHLIPWEYPTLRVNVCLCCGHWATVSLRLWHEQLVWLVVYYKLNARLCFAYCIVRFNWFCLQYANALATFCSLLRYSSCLLETTLNVVTVRHRAFGVRSISVGNNVKNRWYRFCALLRHEYCRSVSTWNFVGYFFAHHHVTNHVGQRWR